MDWTEEWPTEPGLYFCWGGHKDSAYFKSMVCKVRTAGPEDKPFTVWIVDGHFIHKSEADVLFWPEPIKEPSGGNEVFAKLFANKHMSRILEDGKKPWSTSEKVETPLRLASQTAKLFELDETNPPTWLLEMATGMMSNE